MITSNIPEVLAFLRKIPEARGAVIEGIQKFNWTKILRPVARGTLRAQWQLERSVAKRELYEQMQEPILNTIMKVPVEAGVLLAMRIPGPGSAKKFTGPAADLLLRDAFGPQAAQALDVLPPDEATLTLKDSLREILQASGAVHSPTGRERHPTAMIHEGDFSGSMVEEVTRAFREHFEAAHNLVHEWVIQVKHTEDKDKYHTRPDGSRMSDEEITRALEYVLGMRGAGEKYNPEAVEKILPHLVEFLLGGKDAPTQGFRVTPKVRGIALGESQKFETQAAAQAHADRENETMSPGSKLRGVQHEVEGIPLQIAPEVVADWLDAVLKAWTAEVLVHLHEVVQTALAKFFAKITAKQKTLKI